MKTNVLSRFAPLGFAIAIMAGCASDAANPVGPMPKEATPANAIGIGSPGIAEVCIDPASPPAIYHIALSNLQNIQPIDVVAGSPITINTGAPGPICANAIVRAGQIGGVIASVTMTASADRAGTFTYVCNDDTGLTSCANGTGTNDATAGENGYHGSTVTFKLVAGAPPNPIPTPLFVIGDATYRGVGDAVYFWGPDWWKDNKVTGKTDPGVAAFKGFTTSADNFCGGTWVSRPGNPPPVPTLDGRIAIIVTSGVNKKGNVFSGTISQILLVDPNPGFSPSPGHIGTGTVTTIACTL